MSRESLSARKTRAQKILRGLHKLYPDADCALHHRSALELLVATVLSAQSTDETVNRVTKALFQKYKTVDDYADAPLGALEDAIRATGFFRQKARNIQNACRMIRDEFGGKVPDALDDLIRLPGVARKTANVLLGTWFGKNEGVVVDTHVGRLAERMGLTWTGRSAKDAVNIEQDLMQLIPQKQWTFFGHAMIWHGRRICTARRPDCETCTLAVACPSAGKVDSVKASGARHKKAAGKKASAGSRARKRG